MSIDPIQYATADEYRASVQMTIATNDGEINSVLEAMSRGIDNEMGRFFGKDLEPTTRIYVPGKDSPLTERHTVLTVDDISSATGLSIKLDEDDDGKFALETPLAEDDVELLPLNAQKGPEPWPFTKIRMTEWGSAGAFALNQRVEVTARFGWPSVPRAIKHATIQLAAIWRMESARATQRVPELGDVMQTSPEAQMIVLRLREKYGRGQYV